MAEVEQRSVVTPLRQLPERRYLDGPARPHGLIKDGLKLVGQEFMTAPSRVLDDLLGRRSKQLLIAVPMATQ